MGEEQVSSTVDGIVSGRIDRRRLLQGAAVAGAIGFGGGIAGSAGALQVRRWLRMRRQVELCSLGGESEPAGAWLPYRATGGAETQVFDLIFSRLIRFDADYNLIPDLAERYEVNPEASEFTFFAPGCHLA